MIEHPLIQLVCLTIFHTGLRIDECVRLRNRDVDFGSRKITVTDLLGNFDRTVPMNKTIAESLRKHIDERVAKSHSDERVFCTDQTGRLSASYVRHVMQMTTFKLGWNKRITPHTFRHSFAPS